MAVYLEADVTNLKSWRVMDGPNGFIGSITERGPNDFLAIHVRTGKSRSPVGDLGPFRTRDEAFEAFKRALGKS